MKKITMSKNLGSRQYITLEEAFQKFIKMCRHKNLSPNTISTYEWHYKIFIKCIDRNTPVTEIDRK
jgi:hypothetical protein